ncbi:glycosyltransferase family 2 protein [bacterium]|nr:MAG: glycosyltransferase family 2 protein [bacterium]
MPRISVCTSVYNGMAYFDRAIPTILSQTLEDFEFIIYDDGSDDGTGERLAEIAKTDPRILLIPSDGERRGLAEGLNHCVRHSSAPYCCQQDFDDLSTPIRLAAQVKAFDENPNVGVVGGAYQVLNEIRKEDFIRRPPLDHESIVRRMAKAVPFAATCMAFRKQAWEDAGGYAPVKNLTDMNFYLRVLKTGKWKFMAVEEVLGTHHVHGESFFNNSMRYRERQNHLARVQAQIVRETDLPAWMGIYPMARRVYPSLPPFLKKVARKVVGFKED